MAFDPDEYLAEKSQTDTFDPDAYLAEKTSEDASTSKGRNLDVIREIQAPRGFVENAKFIADDVNNQFNNNLAIIAGAPVDLIALGLNKASNAIFDRDIVASDSFGGSESIRRGMGSLPFAGPVRNEPAKTKRIL